VSSCLVSHSALMAQQVALSHWTCVAAAAAPCGMPHAVRVAWRSCALSISCSGLACVSVRRSRPPILCGTGHSCKRTDVTVVWLWRGALAAVVQRSAVCRAQRGGACGEEVGLCRVCVRLPDSGACMGLLLDRFAVCV